MTDLRLSLNYTGTVQPTLEERASAGLTPYLPSPELVNAVRLTIFLQRRPLLIKGEPGSGKTRLAKAVAYELGMPYFEWSVKSTSRARDGFYTYDGVQRLYDAQLARAEIQDRAYVANPLNYVRWGELGNAFQEEKRSVVLIDEIDKADIDFPNDLLLELDQQRFKIPEAGAGIEVAAKYPPIIFITSNDEKDLPDAFLRRCLFHYISFPAVTQLMDIVTAHFPESSPELVAAAVARFALLRKQMEQDKGRVGKKVGTSELLDWFTVLRQHPTDQVLVQLQGKLPYSEVLLKSWEDHLRYLEIRSRDVA